MRIKSKIPTLQRHVRKKCQRGQKQILTETKKETKFSNILNIPTRSSHSGIFKRPLSVATTFRQGKKQSLYKLSTLHTHSQSRGYRILTSTSSQSPSGQDDKSKSNIIPNTTSAEATPPPKEVQEDLDALLAIAYEKAKQISSLATTRRKPKSSRKGTETDSSMSSITHVPALATSTESLATIEEEDRDSSSHSHSFPDVNIVMDPIDQESREKVDAIRGNLDIRDEVNAVEALLSMTSHPYFHKALARQREQNSIQNDAMNVSLSLHSAFLSVVSWLLGTLCSIPTVKETDERVNFIQAPNSDGDGDAFGNGDSDIDGDAVDDKDAEYFVTGPSKQSILLTQILHLTDRSRELNLPLTIPQYQTIASMIAKHSTSTDKSISILDLSTSISDLYSTSSVTDTIDGESQSQLFQAHFFSGALLELLKRNQLRDMVELLHGMQNIHGIDHVDLQTGMELLNLLKEKVDEESSVVGTKMTDFDMTDAMELAMILQKPVMNELQSKRRELETYQDEISDTMSTLMDHDDEEDDFDESVDAEVDVDEKSTMPLKEIHHDGNDCKDDHILNSADQQIEEYDGYENDVKELNDIMEQLSTSSEGEEDASALRAKSKLAAEAIIEKLRTAKDPHSNESDSKIDSEESKSSAEKAPSVSTRFHVDPTTGEVENIEFTFTAKPKDISGEEKQIYDAMYQDFRDLIYCRDESWSLPDVVPQLEEWNNDRGLLFSKDFEEDLLADRLEYEDMLPPTDADGIEEDKEK